MAPIHVVRFSGAAAHSLSTLNLITRVLANLFLLNVVAAFKKVSDLNCI